MGKLAQAIAHGAILLQVKGNFDDCLKLARQLSENYPVSLVNSVNPYRIEGQKTAAFEVVDMLGFAPDIHAMPVGNAGNITAYWKGYQEYKKAGNSGSLPMMWGFQAAGAAPIVKNKIIKKPETIATAIRIGNPASWDQAVAAQVGSKGLIDSVTDKEILSAYRLVAAKEGVFVEPSSAAGIAGLIKLKAQKKLPKGKTIVVTVTGNGLKDVQWVLNSSRKPIVIPVDVKRAAKAIGLK
jgi:threonine synthase